MRPIITGTIILTILFLGCNRNYSSITQSQIKADWISEDKNGFLFIEDSLMLQTMIISSEIVVKYGILGDTLFIYSKDSEDYSNLDRKNLTWKYKILNLDSINLTLIRLFPQPYDTLTYSRIAHSKRNNLKITNLELSAGPCFGHCPVFDLKITADSMLYQYGYYYTQHLGLNKHKLNALEYQRIQSKLQSISLDSLIFSQPGPDRQYYNLYINSGNSIQINGNLEWNSYRDLKAFIFYLLHLDKFKNLKPTNDSIYFKNTDNYERFVKNNINR